MDTALCPAAGSPPRGALWVAAALLALAAASGCVKKPDTTLCPTGVYCPAGTRCAARQAACIRSDCGDLVLQPGEQCDDGNIWDADGCNSVCQIEVCGNGTRDWGEECDDGNLVDGDECSAQCTVEACGNGRIDVGEQCDPGVTPWCDRDCTLPICGDGTRNQYAGEECDDGNASNADDCVAGCTPATCGDGFVDGITTSALFEECDDGPSRTDDPHCAYGERTCERCSRACRRLTPVTSYCGDDRLDPAFEPCDSTTSIQQCGTCRVVNALTCETVAPRSATGSIVVLDPAGLVSGSTLVLADGTNPPLTIVFEPHGDCTMDTAGPPPVGCVETTWANDTLVRASEIALRIATVMTIYPNAITAGVAHNSPEVTLTHNRDGFRGNQPIQQSRIRPGAVTVTGMQGGTGCELNDGCSVSTDCVSGLTCQAGRCQ